MQESENHGNGSESIFSGTVFGHIEEVFSSKSFRSPLLPVQKGEKELEGVMTDEECAIYTVIVGLNQQIDELMLSYGMNPSEPVRKTAKKIQDELAMAHRLLMEKLQARFVFTPGEKVGFRVGFKLVKIPDQRMPGLSELFDQLGDLSKNVRIRVGGDPFEMGMAILGMMGLGGFPGEECNCSGCQQRRAAEAKENEQRGQES